MVITDRKPADPRRAALLRLGASGRWRDGCGGWGERAVAAASAGWRAPAKNRRLRSVSLSATIEPQSGRTPGPPSSRRYRYVMRARTRFCTSCRRSAYQLKVAPSRIFRGSRGAGDRRYRVRAEWAVSGATRCAFRERAVPGSFSPGA